MQCFSFFYKVDTQRREEREEKREEKHHYYEQCQSVGEDDESAVFFSKITVIFLIFRLFFSQLSNSAI
jgi:hypothetical protein